MPDARAISEGPIMPDLTAIDLAQISDLALRWSTNGFWAVIIVIAGFVLAGWAERGVKGGLMRVKGCDAMLRGFFSSLTKWVVLVFVGIAALERLGVQTTSMVAVLGAAGLAVGLALQGTLSNLASGVMLLLFRPFKVGDAVEAGAVSGTIREVSLFHTVLATGDNIQVIAPNSVLWSAALRNLSAYSTRKVEIVVPVPFGEDVDAAIERLRAILAADTRVLPEPGAGIAVAKLGEKTVDLSVTAWCEAAHAGSLKSDLCLNAWRQCLRGRA